LDRVFGGIVAVRKLSSAARPKWLRDLLADSDGQPVVRGGAEPPAIQCVVVDRCDVGADAPIHRFPVVLDEPITRSNDR
jgi:hypothetical protein